MAQQSKELINSFATYIMRGRREAIICAMFTAIIPLMGWLAAIIICLVTLRKGTKEGAVVLLAVLVVVIVTGVFFFNPSLIIETALFTYVLPWLLASLLRETASWSYVVEAIGLLAIVVILLTHIIVPHLSQIYIDYLSEAYGKFVAVQGQEGLTASEAKEYIAWLARFMTGLQATLYILGDISNLAIARWLQSRLYNPGGFYSEIIMIRLSWGAVIALLMSLSGLIFGWGALQDCILPILFIYLAAALSLIHYLARTRPKSTALLVVFYIVAAIFIPFSVIPLIVLSLIDVKLDLRTKLVGPLRG